MADEPKIAHEDIAEVSDILIDTRQLLLDCDSNLSAYGHGRSFTKEEALRLSDRCRALWKRLNPKEQP